MIPGIIKSTFFPSFGIPLPRVTKSLGAKSKSPCRAMTTTYGGGGTWKSDDLSQLLQWKISVVSVVNLISIRLVS